MQNAHFEAGVYIIDQDYRILYCNQATKDMYPDVKEGECCYRTLACREEPCESCPLQSPNALFYNPVRREWIAADAAAMEIPGRGECYSIHFQLRQRMSFSTGDMITDEEALGYLMELDESLTGTECLVGGYCEEGFPLFYVNDRTVAMLGYDDREDFIRGIGGLVSNLIHPDDREQVHRELGDLPYEFGKTYESVFRMPRKDGRWMWVVNRGKIIRSMEGRPASISYFVDLTSLIRRQETLMQQNEHLLRRDRMTNTMMQNMPSGYHRCAAKPGCPFLFIGDHFCQIVGWSREEIQRDFGNLYYNLVWPEDTDIMTTYTDMLNLIGHGNSYDTSIYRMKRKDGGYRWVLDSTMFVDLGEDSFFQATIADITEFVEEQAEQRRQLEAAMARIEKISQAKSSFLFNMSHDLRTPMNAIKGFTHMLAMRPDDGDYVRQTVQKIEQSSDTLMQLLGDVLELSRIESGKDDLSLTALSVNDFCEKLYLMFVQEIESVGIRFRMEKDIQHPCIMCDELKCTRIIMNMLSNAKKFTPAGGEIMFSVTELDGDDRTGTYRFTVKDTGIGMSEEFMARAFEEFERERTSTDSGISGSGLGLAIIHRLIGLMGGECLLNSVQGQGTEISAILPFPLLEESTCPCCHPKERHIRFHGERVLLVEDNAFNREIARFVLEDLNLTVDEATDGEQAIQILTDAKPGHYALILMDIQMPNMNGYAATAAIRALPNPKHAQIPIIAMTANAFSEDKERCFAAGMNAHISKPVDTRVVMQTIADVLGI